MVYFCTILHPDESVISKVTHSDGQYHMTANIAETITKDQYTLYVNATWRPLSLYKLHCCLGHIHYGAMRDAIQDGHIEGLKIDPNNADEQFCKACEA